MKIQFLFTHAEQLHDIMHGKSLGMKKRIKKEHAPAIESKVRTFQPISIINRNQAIKKHVPPQHYEDKRKNITDFISDNPSINASINDGNKKINGCSGFVNSDGKPISLADWLDSKPEW